MLPGHTANGSISGRVTTADESCGIPNTYVAVVNRYNLSQAYYVGSTDANGFYQFGFVSNSYNGTGYEPKYVIYTDSSLFGYAYSDPFAVQQSSTSPVNVKIVNGETPYPGSTKAPPMQPGHDYTGSVSGRITTYNTSYGISVPYVAIVNACNPSEAFYEGFTDLNGFYNFSIVNNTYEGSQYQPKYKVYAGSNYYGFAYSNSFLVEMNSTAAVNDILVDWRFPLRPPTPTTLHYPCRDIQVGPAPKMSDSQHFGAVTGRVTTNDPSVGIANADVLIVNAANIMQAYYVGKSDSKGYFQFVGVNSSYNPSTSTYDNGYKVYAYSSAYGEGFSNSFPVEPYTAEPANVVIIPQPATIDVSLSRNYVVANGSDTLDIWAYITDRSGNPVADGTLIYFIIDNGSTYNAAQTGHWKGSLDQSVMVQTNHGYANFTYGWVPASSMENSVNLTLISAGNSSVNTWFNIPLMVDPANIAWSGAYHGGPACEGLSMAPTTDGFVVVGLDLQNLSHYNVTLAKTDLNGNLLWNKTYCEIYGCYGCSVVAVHDGYVITGLEYVNCSNTDVLLMKVDPNGSKVWSKTYGGASQDSGSEVIAVSDGYVIAGISYSSTNHNGDVYVIKTDLNGNLIWQKTYGGFAYDMGYSIAATDDGYIVIGDTLSYGHGSYDVYLLKIDKNGNLIWEKTFGGAGDDKGSSVVAMSDGYVITGETSSFSADNSTKAYLLKTDLAGNLLWQKTFGGNLYNSGAAIKAVSDGYLIGGTTMSYGAGIFNIYAVKTDLNGNLVWQEVFGRGFWDQGSAIAVVKDGYVIAGTSFSPDLKTVDMYMVKLTEPQRPVTPCTASYHYTLYEGWNLISIPVELQDYNLSSVFQADVMSNISCIWGWNESDQNWVYYSPDSNDYFYQYYPGLTKLEFGKAYWVQMNHPESLTIHGTVPGSAPDSPIILHSGWNFIGTTGMSRPSIASMYPNSDCMWGWDESSQNWVYYSPDSDDYFYQYYPDLSYARPGHGYWVDIP